jgi:myosin protein heavy chain
LRAAQLENLSRNAGRPSLASPLNDEFIAEMEKRVEILMAENAVMMEQKVVLTEEFDKCRADIATYQEELTILSQQYNVIKQENADNKTMLAQAERDRAKATEEVAKASEALAKAEVEVDELKQQLFVLTEKNHRTDDELGETRRALKDLSDRAESEGFACVRRTKAAEDRVRELQGVLLIKTQELDVAQDTLSKLRREYQSTRQDAEGLLQVMAGLERQLTEYAAREAEVERVEKECKDRIEEATIARDQALAREHQFQRSYEKILEDRRLEAQEKQVIQNGSL